jgi:hypothetical protein
MLQYLSYIVFCLLNIINCYCHVPIVLYIVPLFWVSRTLFMSYLKYSISFVFLWLSSSSDRHKTEVQARGSLPFVRLSVECYTKIPLHFLVLLIFYYVHGKSVKTLRLTSMHFKPSLFQEEYSEYAIFTYSHKFLVIKGGL